MAFQPVPNTVKAELTFLQDSVPLQNVFHFSRAGSPTQAQMEDLADALKTWVEGTYQINQASTCLFQGVTLTRLESQNDIQVQLAGNGFGGDDGSGAMPSNVTKAFTLRSGLTGRSARGRFFFCGIANGDITPDRDHVGATWVDDVVDALEALKLVVEALGWIWTIVSRYTNNAQRSAGVTFPVQSFGVSDLTTDSARFRMPKN